MPFSINQWPMLFLAAAVALLYLTGRVAATLLPAWADRSIVRAMIAAASTVAVSVAAVVAGRPVLALHLPVAVAVLSVVAGLAVLLAVRPRGAKVLASWSLVVPAVMIALLVALEGKLDAIASGSLALFGLISLTCWQRTDESLRHNQHSPRDIVWMAAIPVLGTVVVVAAWLAVASLPASDRQFGRSSDSVMAIIFLAPAIVIPAIFECLTPGRSLSWTGSVSTMLKLAVVTLCLVLPLVGQVSIAWPLIADRAGWSVDALNRQVLSTEDSQDQTEHQGLTTADADEQAATRPAVATAPAAGLSREPGKVLLPAVIGYVDLPVLLLASLAVVPLSFGIHSGKLESSAIALLYAVYILLSMAALA